MCIYQVLLIILILVIRLGAATSSLANIDVNLLMIGTSVGFSIIVSAIILTHILGGNISILEVNTNLILVLWLNLNFQLIVDGLGALLFLTVGGVSIHVATSASSSNIFYKWGEDIGSAFTGSSTGSTIAASFIPLGLDCHCYNFTLTECFLFRCPFLSYSWCVHRRPRLETKTHKIRD